MSAAKRIFQVRPRDLVVLALDVLVAVAALHAALWLRTGGVQPPATMYDSIWGITPLVAVLAACAHIVFGMRHMSWRYTSVYDLKVIVKFTGVVVIGMIAMLATYDLGEWRPRSVPVIYAILTIGGLMATRLARRLVSEFMQGSIFPPKAGASTGEDGGFTLFAGKGSRVELMLRANERNQIPTGRPLGILLNDSLMPLMKIRGVPVLGTPDDLSRIVEEQAAAGKQITRLVFAETPERLREAPFLQLVVKAESMGLTIFCLPDLEAYLKDTPQAEGEVVEGQALRKIRLSDLLGRPQNEMDCEIVGQSIRGRKVLVTGAGGTIGRELVRQIASFGPAQLVMLENSEFGLYDVDAEMKADFPEIPRAAVLCCIRQRGQVMEAFKQYQPELVFHAAALKHVPIVEAHPSAGVQTNIIGTRNVADAAKKFGVKTMVQVSTDKAVNPVGMMGATKRLGEAYCQALDLEGNDAEDSARFLTVRFGNVLGSSGSLIPLFEKQLQAGGPLTVTHPEITRFFMTVQEAVSLVLQASARSAGVERGRIFVLDMGEPIKVLDIAKRMIRLSGKVPDKDVKIKFVGLRPGEKLYEELFNDHEQQMPSVLDGIFEAEPEALSTKVLNDTFDRLDVLAEHADDWAVKNLTFRLLNEGEATLKPHPETQPVPDMPEFAAASLNGKAANDKADEEPAGNDASDLEEAGQSA